MVASALACGVAGRRVILSDHCVRVDGGRMTGSFRQQASHRVQRLAHQARPPGQGATGDETSWLRDALDTIATPTLPLMEPWELSMAALLRKHPAVPSVLSKAAGSLDRLGAVAVSPTGLGFDGQHAEWGEIVRLETDSARHVLGTLSLQHELERLRAALPPVPGRKWAVGKVSESLLTLLNRGLDKVLSEDSVGASVVAGVYVQARFNREKVVASGLFGALVLTALPEVNSAILATAKQTGILVVPRTKHGVAKDDTDLTKLQLDLEHDAKTNII